MWNCEIIWLVVTNIASFSYMEELKTQLMVGSRSHHLQLDLYPTFDYTNVTNDINLMIKAK